jgi:hypothetical protein
MWKTWFFDGDRNLFDELIEIVKGYEFKQRFISHEKVNSKGEVKPHFHILCEMENVKPWNSMTAHLIRIYKLKEKNKELNKDHKGSGGYRCYGASDKDVYTPDKFTRYIAKDGDIWGDIPAGELEKIIKEATKKEDDRNWNEKLCVAISEKSLILRFNNHDRSGYYYNDKMLKVEIIKLYRKHGVVCSKIKIENSFNYIAQMSKNPAIRMTDDELLEYFYG